MADAPQPGSRRARRLEEARRATIPSGQATTPMTRHPLYAPQHGPPQGPQHGPPPAWPAARSDAERVHAELPHPELPHPEGLRIGGTSELRGARRVLNVAALPALGVLLLVWALTTLVGDVRWGPFSVLPVVFACLSPLAVVAAVPLVLVTIQQRRWAAMVPAVVAAALPWWFVVGYGVSASAEPSGATLPLRAMIVTARDGHADARDIADVVRSQRTDLLVVTELSPALAHDLAVAGLPDGMVPRYVRVPESGTSPAGGIGVYSRFTIDEKQVTSLPGTRWPAVVAPVRVGPTTVTLVAGHAVRPSTDHLDRWRRDLAAFGSADQLRGPVLVLVNLNATPWNPQFRTIVSGRLHDAADVLGRGLRPTWPAWSPVPLLPTDHALVAGLSVSDLSALTIKGSDHRALSVGLRVPDPTGRS
jgi:endonuclease/exonuclease/phosphatase (EEP) superfamily protein YafD